MFLGGPAGHWAQYGSAIRQAATEIGNPVADIELLGIEGVPQIRKELGQR